MTKKLEEEFNLPPIEEVTDTENVPTVQESQEVIEEVQGALSVSEKINLECTKMELDILKTKTDIEKSSFVNLLNQNRSLIDENQRLKNKYEKENKERCPICLEDIDNFIVTVCNHKFCNDCFT